jgi:Zn-dependent protease/tetratricopeptide (TPR) repeat protein
LGAKIKAALVFLKFGSILLTLSTMLVAYKFYAYFYGWKFGLGILLSIFVHEMGHVAVNRAKGLKSSAPIFLPLMGAVIFLKGFPDDPTIQSESGAGGPVAGCLCAIVCLLIGYATHSPYWFGLANFGFLINLFNLTPFPPLDGSHISAVFSPALWNSVLASLLLFVIKFPSPMLWGVLIIAFVIRLGIHDNYRYTLARPAVRLRMAVLYTCLCITLSLGFQATVSNRTQMGSASGQSSVSAAHRTTSTTESYHPAAVTPTIHDIHMFVLISTFVICTGLWFVVAAVLARAASRSVLSRVMLWPFALLLVNSGYLLLYLSTPEVAAWHLAFVTVQLPMAAAGLIYATYSVSNRKKLDAPASYPEYVGRALLWGVAAGMVVAYAADSLRLIIVPVLLTAVLVGVMRWLVFALFAHSSASRNDYADAAKYARQALKYSPPPENRRVLLTYQAQSPLAGNEAVEALKYLDETKNLPGTRAQDEFRVRLTAHAYILKEQYDTAIAGIEELLQYQTFSSLISAQVLVAQLSRHRGWFDDAEVRLRALLSSRTVILSPFSQSFRLELVATLIDGGKLADAETELNAVLRGPIEILQKPTVNLLQAEIYLAQGKPNMAADVLKLPLGDMTALEERYRLGRLKDQLGVEEGRTELAALATTYPDETWGLRAMRFLRGEKEAKPPGADTISLDL